MARDIRFSIELFNIIIIDDSDGFRTMLKARLEESPLVKVVAEAADEKDALQIAAANVWDLAVVDINLPSTNGFKLTRSMLKMKPGSKVVITSSSDEADYPRLAKEAGAISFVAKRRLTTKEILGVLEGKRED